MSLKKYKCDYLMGAKKSYLNLFLKQGSLKSANTNFSRSHQNTKKHFIFKFTTKYSQKNAKFAKII
ncbi:hypothetical protein CHL9004_02390 [Campylobacter hyointestinalis subsp. lawsonii]|nr:hypothetical protein CHL9004_02390 [Campylobacter hyointestinalis subsp. lawsonii]RAZ56802.1 hypothetical protein CHL10074_02080 [Campylobacter hyointestinalis subsp. lawsonii]RAZ64833.1 hypothetical protein CHL9767_02395 [Campylobacter hyointestinalis subsp. lawsonii]